MEALILGWYILTETGSVESLVLFGSLASARTTSDTAPVAGALAGTGAVAFVGMGPAYALVTALYVGAFVLSLGVAGSPPSHGASATKTLAGLKQAVGYVLRMPEQLGA